MLLEIVFLGVALFLILLCGLFVASEFSFVTVDRATVLAEAESGSKRARSLDQALKHLSTHLSAAQIGITLTNLLIGFLAEPSISSLLQRLLPQVGLSQEVLTGLALTLGFLLANFLTMLFGELVPKNIALSLPLQTAKNLAAFQRTFSYLIRPLLLFSNGIANRLLLRLGIEPQEELASARSAQELESLIERSAEKGTLDLSTAKLLEQTLDFSEKNAEDAMTPRAQVLTLSPGDRVEDLINLVESSGRSRFPVVQGEDILGLAHLKHALAVPSSERSSVGVVEITKEAALVPASLDLDVLLARLRGEGMQLGIVVDEFGSFCGVVTLEDLVEEIIGEVYDEHDSEEMPLLHLGPQEWQLSGLLRPDEIFRLTGVNLPEDRDYETVAGLLIDHLERLPRVGDSIHLEARDSEDEEITVLLRVRSIEGLRIDKVYMRVT